MFWEKEGSGAPVLLIHGLGASSHIFDALVEKGAHSSTFHRLDLPHAGRSGGYASMQIDDLAARIASELAARKTGPVSVVGHSFGGLVALALATREPSLVRGLVLASVPAFGLGRLEALLKLETAGAVAWIASHLPMSRYLVALYLRRIWGAAAPLTDATIDAYVRAVDSPQFLPSQLEAGREIAAFQLPPLQARHSFPIRVLWGREDPVVPLSQGEKLAHALDAPLDVLPHTGHCFPEEQPEVLLEAIRSMR
jgi:pimeloyl-ACP methyl ester carboxylesterase